jgi:hypothetical protein
MTQQRCTAFGQKNAKLFIFFELAKGWDSLWWVFFGAAVNGKVTSLYTPTRILREFVHAFSVNVLRSFPPTGWRSFCVFPPI